MGKGFASLLTAFVFAFALNFGMLAYANETETTEMNAQSELPEGVTPLPEFVEAE